MSFRRADNGSRTADSRRPPHGYSASSSDIGTRDEIADKNQACKASLKNTLSLLADTDRISQKTADKLCSQTEQLHRIHDQTENINHNLDHSQWVLQSMKSWWGRGKSLIAGPPKREGKDDQEAENKDPKTGLITRTGKDPKTRKDIKDNKSPRQLPPTLSQRQTSPGSGQGANQKLHVNRIVTQELSEEDRDMDQMLHMLDDIKERSMDIGRSIDTQNRLISGISENVDLADVKMAKSQKDIKSLM